MAVLNLDEIREWVKGQKTINPVKFMLDDKSQMIDYLIKENERLQDKVDFLELNEVGLDD